MNVQRKVATATINGNYTVNSVNIDADQTMTLTAGASLSSQGGNATLTAQNTVYANGAVSISGDIFTNGGNLSITADAGITLDTQSNAVTLSSTKQVAMRAISLSPGLTSPWAARLTRRS